MDYQVVFDVSERIPVLVIGVVALVAFGLVGIAAFLDFDALLVRWRVVLGLGCALLLTQAVVNRERMAILIALVFAGGGLVAELTQRQSPSPRNRQGLPKGGGGLAFGTFALVFTMFNGLPMIPALWLKDQLADGQATIVEGPVRITFELPMKNECIEVAERDFCYSDNTVMPGFNRTRALGGPMFEGANVRLSLIGDQIVRVEVAR